MKKLHGIIALAALVVLAAGCTQEHPFGDRATRPVAFGATAYWENEAATRTEYSGEDENGLAINTGSQYERIDWVKDIDIIRVYCQSTTGGPLLDGKAADYKVTGNVTVQDQKSISEMTPAGADVLYWGTGAHVFFALYPAAGMVSEQGRTVAAADAKIEPVAGTDNAVVITGKLPASQTLYHEGTSRVYKPDMNYAYMFARSSVASPSSKVTLPFSPLVTAFDLTLKAISDDMLTTKLSSVKLTSTTSDMSASQFKVRVNATGDATLTEATGTGREIVATIPDGGVMLSPDEAVKLTLFALPVNQENLTLTLTFANGATRTLALKRGNAFIPVPARQKVYISNIGVPGSIYYLEASGPEAAINSIGDFSYFKVKSFRDQSGEDQPVGWTAEFSVNGGTTWTATRPDWLFGFVDTDATGSLTEKSYLLKVKPNFGAHSKQWTGATTVSGNMDEDSAIDLSMRNVMNGAISRSTANCYVVSRPGYYKIPCVYGNAYKNGAKNEVAYSNSNPDGHALKKFHNHLGNGISDPWIKNNGITLQSAKLLWQDAWNLVRKVKYEADYVYFYVDPETIFQGNALIAVLDDSGRIAWSWHIWVTDRPGDLGTKDIYYPAPSFDKHKKVAQVNVGWCDKDDISAAPARNVQVRICQNTSGKTVTFTIRQNASSVVNSVGYCTYYQWGRKDALLPSYGIPWSSADHPQWADPDLWGTAGVNDRLFYKGNDVIQQQSLAYSIQNPNVFIVCGFASRADHVAHNTNNWCATRYDNLWDAEGTDYTDHDVVKTVYDPCPFGYKLPNKDVFNGTTTTGRVSAVESEFRVSGGFDNGWHFVVHNDMNDTIFMPATGLRINTWRVEGNTGNGNVGGVGQKGDYWTGTCSSGNAENPHELDFLFYSDQIDINNGTGTRGWASPSGPSRMNNPRD